MKSVREQIGDRPVYFTFDIDGIDPCYCPGTGTERYLYIVLDVRYVC